MDAVKVGLMASGGTLVVIASGSLWWLLPMLAYVAVAVYEHTTTPDERPAWLRPGSGRRVLVDAARDVRAYVADGTVPRFLTAAPRPARVEGAEGTPAAAPAQAAPQVRQRGEAAEPRPKWAQILNDEPDRLPHALILGPTGAGKTTLATAIMGDRGGRSVVISPKIGAGSWRGAEVITLDDDGSYAPISQALADLEQEKRDRIVTLRKHGRDALEPLTIVLDEIQELTARQPEAGEMMVSMSSIGREIKMRLIGVGTTDDALNIRGWKASRPNYARVTLDADRRAKLSDGVREIPIGTKEVVSRAKAARLKPWRGVDLDPVDQPQAEPARVLVTPQAPAAAPLDLSDLLGDLLVSPLPESVRAEVPAISSDRAARLAAILDRQQVTVDRGPGQVVVNVSQQAAGSSARRTSTGLTVQGRRRRLGYIEAARRGEKFDPTYRRLGGNRNDMHALFTEHKAVSER